MRGQEPTTACTGGERHLPGSAPTPPAHPPTWCFGPTLIAATSSGSCSGGTPAARVGGAKRPQRSRSAQAHAGNAAAAHLQQKRRFKNNGSCYAQRRRTRATDGDSSGGGAGQRRLAGQWRQRREARRVLAHGGRRCRAGRQVHPPAGRRLFMMPTASCMSSSTFSTRPEREALLKCQHCWHSGDGQGPGRDCGAVGTSCVPCNGWSEAPPARRTTLWQRGAADVVLRRPSPPRTDEVDRQPAALGFQAGALRSTTRQ